MELEVSFIRGVHKLGHPLDFNTGAGCELQDGPPGHSPVAAPEHSRLKELQTSESRSVAALPSQMCRLGHLGKSLERNPALAPIPAAGCRLQLETE